jgi:hypothetical protein
LVFPEIMQELNNGRSGGDSSAGVINDAFWRVAVPGRMSNQARGWWEKDGLLGPRTGQPAGKELAGSNPAACADLGGHRAAEQTHPGVAASSEMRNSSRPAAIRLSDKALFIWSPMRRQLDGTVYVPRCSRGSASTPSNHSRDNLWR